MKKILSIILLCVFMFNSSVFSVENDNPPVDLANNHFVPNYEQVFTPKIYDLGLETPANLSENDLLTKLNDNKIKALNLYIGDMLKEKLRTHLGINNKRRVCKIVGGVITALGTGAAGWFTGFLAAGFTANAGYKVTNVLTDALSGPGVDAALVENLEKEINAWYQGLMTEPVFKSECAYIMAKYHGKLDKNAQKQIEQVLIEARDRSNLRFDPMKFVHHMLLIPQECMWLPPQSDHGVESFATSVLALIDKVKHGHTILSDYAPKIKEQFGNILSAISSCARNSFHVNAGNENYMELRRHYVFFADPGIGQKKAPLAIAEALEIPYYEFRPMSLLDDDVYGTSRYCEHPKEGELTKIFTQKGPNYQNAILHIDIDFIKGLNGNLEEFLKKIAEIKSFESPFYEQNIDLSKMHIIYSIHDYALNHPEFYFDLLEKSSHFIEFEDLNIDTKEKLLRQYVQKNNIFDHSIIQHDLGSKNELVDLIIQHKAHFNYKQMTQLADKLANAERKYWDDILGLYKPSQQKDPSLESNLKQIDGFIFRNGHIFRSKLKVQLEKYELENPTSFALSLDGEASLDTKILAIDSDQLLENSRFIPHKISLLESPYLYVENYTFYLTRLHHIVGVLKPDLKGGGNPKDWRVVEFNYAEKTKHALDGMNLDLPILEDGLYHIARLGHDLEFTALDKNFKTGGKKRAPNAIVLLDHLKPDAKLTQYEAIYDQIMMPLLRVLDLRAFVLEKKQIDFLNQYLKNPRQKDLQNLCLNGDGMRVLRDSIAELPHLRQLILTNSDLKNADSAKIASMQYLDYLDLRGNPDLDFASLGSFVKLIDAHKDGTKPLRFLSLSGMKPSKAYQESIENGRLMKISIHLADVADIQEEEIVFEDPIFVDDNTIQKPQSFIHLANAYKNGYQGFAKNPAKARFYFEKAIAHNNNYLAKYQLAEMLEEGLGGDIDVVRAKRLYKESTEINHYKEGQYKYALLLLKTANKEDLIACAVARSWFQKAANQNHLMAQWKLAEMYREGLGGEKNIEEAKKWYKKCANESSNAAYIFEFARRCHLGNLWPKDLAEARLFYQKAADKKSAEAAYQYALFCHDALGGNKDEVNAKIYFKKAADLNQREACYMYAHFYGGEASFYKKAADQGHMEAQYEYAKKSHGDEARVYFKKAADQKHKEAQYGYARYCYNGWGGAEDKMEAKAYYKKAAEQNHEKSQEQYGRMCYRGEGGAADFTEARKYYKMLLETEKKDYEGFDECYAWMCHNGKGGAVDYKESRKYYYKHASRLNNGDSYEKVASIDYYGKDGVKNLETARSNYKRAADLGEAHSQYSYGYMCYHGQGGPSNSEEAYLYMKKASAQGNEEAKKWLNSGCSIM
jgi:TPR repeat protein